MAVFEITSRISRRSLRNRSRRRLQELCDQLRWEEEDLLRRLHEVRVAGRTKDELIELVLKQLSRNARMRQALDKRSAT
ncbi:MULTISPECIES: hypothetical protein [Methylobacterium]|jgi:hypothetical protein|uniref:Ribbon-helix-helix protein CopG domain-containing protein n=1 Tax=Methylobacterium jeotgali TaxID=381630 RepID=A0ABQ4SUE8_9HYPH|nr:MULTISPECIES: hypothetical protein [Methylobacterium]PIU05666.1 MAG: hypothetical protein COT56_13560 [Methylobacterium sp. CG09_land_8_20_14_0_10_71_15]PIU12376.1 MAG: hypothetical protein COT28_15405 [Methylobacterium sp. CG08_land_8_20_14_0_20_71_15]GBU16888.1 hypothetical protein AwMethylo_11030 [Methylobacterium sp.]GJE06842.1 hypothetical protein AOPFMNJM_2164 [Methylobacterium jeotgali]